MLLMVMVAIGSIAVVKTVQRTGSYWVFEMPGGTSRTTGVNCEAINETF
jgi:hypothetical protein